MFGYSINLAGCQGKFDPKTEKLTVILMPTRGWADVFFTSSPRSLLITLRPVEWCPTCCDLARAREREAAPKTSRSDVDVWRSRDFE